MTRLCHNHHKMSYSPQYGSSLCESDLLQDYAVMNMLQCEWHSECLDGRVHQLCDKVAHCVDLCAEAGWWGQKDVQKSGILVALQFNFRQAIFYRDSFSYTMFHLVAITAWIYTAFESLGPSTHGTLVDWLLHWFIKDRWRNVIYNRNAILISCLANEKCRFACFNEGVFWLFGTWYHQHYHHPRQTPPFACKLRSEKVGHTAVSSYLSPSRCTQRAWEI